MPPTSPQPGFLHIGIVMARLIVNEQDEGIGPFLVWLNDGHSMCKGISTRFGLRMQTFISHFMSNIPF
jgi:hypothetical protein